MHHPPPPIPTPNIINVQHRSIIHTPSTPHPSPVKANHHLNTPTHPPLPNITLQSTFCTNSLSPNTTKHHPWLFSIQYYPNHPPLSINLHLGILSNLTATQTTLCSKLPTSPNTQYYPSTPQLHHPHITTPFTQHRQNLHSTQHYPASRTNLLSVLPFCSPPRSTTLNTRLPASSTSLSSSKCHPTTPTTAHGQHHCCPLPTAPPSTVVLHSAGHSPLPSPNDLPTITSTHAAHGLGAPALSGS